MRVATDATALTLLINPDGSAPVDPTTKKPVADAPERIKLFIAQIENAGGQVIIPTPALAEALVKAGDAGPEILNLLQASARFLIADFDRRAALEVAAMTREALMAGDKSGGSTAPWQKVKFDRQIIAIAKVNRADVLFSDDIGVGKFAERVNLKVLKSWELPQSPPQHDLFDPSRATAVEEAIPRTSIDEPSEEEPDAPVDNAATDDIAASPDPTEAPVTILDEANGKISRSQPALPDSVENPTPTADLPSDQKQVVADTGQQAKSADDK